MRHSVSRLMPFLIYLPLLVCYVSKSFPKTVCLSIFSLCLWLKSTLNSDICICHFVSANKPYEKMSLAQNFKAGCPFILKHLHSFITTLVPTFKFSWDGVIKLHYHPGKLSNIQTVHCMAMSHTPPVSKTMRYDIVCNINVFSVE